MIAVQFSLTEIALFAPTIEVIAVQFSLTEIARFAPTSKVIAIQFSLTSVMSCLKGSKKSKSVWWLKMSDTSQRECWSESRYSLPWQCVRTRPS